MWYFIPPQSKNTASINCINIVFKVKAINDKVDYKENCDAMNSIGFTPDERSSIWKLVAAIVHLVMLNSCALVQWAYDWHNLIMQICWHD